MGWNEIPDDKTIEETRKNLEEKGFNVEIVDSKEEALEAVKNKIPKGAEVYDGSSTTLIEIGYVDYRSSSEHGWNDLHKKVNDEDDEEKRAELRRKSITADYYLGSVNAISSTGELVACDASGSRVGGYPFAAKNLIIVSGVNKITDSLDSAMARVREHAFPLEDKRAQEAYGFNSVLAKWVIMEREIFPGRTTVVLVKDKLGY